MKHFETVLQIAWLANDTVLAEGVHGIGKSERVEAWARMMGMHFEPLFLSQQEVGELIGIPHNVERDGKEIMEWSVPAWLQRMYEAHKEGKDCVLFLDELNRADTDVLQASLQLVLAKQLHEHKLPEGKQQTFIVAAVNPTDDYQTNELDPALLDRFITVELKPDAEEWLAWGRRNGINPIVLKYIASNPMYIHETPEDGSKGTSPRAWTKVSRLLDFLDRDNPALYTILKGRLGAGIGAEFRNFYLNHEDIISISDIGEVVKSNYDKSLTPQENLENTRPIINNLLERQEIPVVHNLVHEIYGICKKKGNYLLLNHICYAVNIEVCTDFIKTLKIEDNNSLNKWADDVGSKGVFARIISKTKIM